MAKCSYRITCTPVGTDAKMTFNIPCDKPLYVYQIATFFEEDDGSPLKYMLSGKDLASRIHKGTYIGSLGHNEWHPVAQEIETKYPYLIIETRYNFDNKSSIEQKK